MTWRRATYRGVSGIARRASFPPDEFLWIGDDGTHAHPLVDDPKLELGEAVYVSVESELERDRVILPRFGSR